MVTGTSHTDVASTANPVAEEGLPIHPEPSGPVRDHRVRPVGRGEPGAHAGRHRPRSGGGRDRTRPYGKDVGGSPQRRVLIHPPGGRRGGRWWITGAPSNRREAFRFNLFTAVAGFVGVRDYLVSTRQFRGLIRRWLPIERIEDAPVPLAVAATDALTGEGVLLTAGDLVDAIAASAAIPGLFPPVRVEGRWLIDGSLSASQPVLHAQALGADETYVITTATAPRLRPPGERSRRP